MVMNLWTWMSPHITSTNTKQSAIDAGTQGWVAVVESEDE